VGSLRVSNVECTPTWASRPADDLPDPAVTRTNERHVGTGEGRDLGDVEEPPDRLTNESADSRVVVPGSVLDGLFQFGI
jgi:hypothetical protein